MEKEKEVVKETKKYVRTSVTVLPEDPVDDDWLSTE